MPQLVSTTPKSVAVIGGGPAGLTCAYTLQKRAPGTSVTVFEADDLVGGISRTVENDGFRVDIGGHRFFTKVPEVEAMWNEVLGSDFIRVPRLSRIYYREKFFDYPLKLFNALSNIGVYESMRIILSYAKWRTMPYKEENSFEEWVINRFGGRLYMHFFRSYTEKVWGISPKNIRADWAAQRIKNLSLPKAVWNAISGANDTVSLIEEFSYPRLGPGMMWEKTAELIEDRGGAVKLRSYVDRVERDGNRIVAVDVKDDTGTHRIEADEFINTMDLRTLLRSMDPPPPQHVQEAAEKLAYRDFLIVAMVLNTAEPFPDNWIYVHTSNVKVGRIQNFRAWSREMVPNENQCLVGMEYFCNEGEELWEMADDDLGKLAGEEIEKLGLAKASDRDWSFVIRQPKAYPVYDTEYKDAVDVIAEWINSLENFQTIGRNGLHRYNNQDHSMLTGMLAAGNILGEDHDLWTVNVDRAYHEEFQRDDDASDEAERKVA
ncbi:MAG: NAD(P)/FAD-dependent oxidoreductase [Pseudomonadota bacterium]